MISHISPDFSPDDLNVDRFQFFTLTRAAHALAGERFIHRAVRLAHEIITFPGEDATAVVIQVHRQMAAKIFVGDQLSLKPRHKTFGGPIVARERKFDRRAIGKFRRAGNFDFRHDASL